MKRKIRWNIVFMVVVSILCIYGVFDEIRTTKELKQEITQNDKLIQELTKEKKQLEKTEKNLKDDNYLIRYARGKYMVTGNDDEQVFKIDD